MARGFEAEFFDLSDVGVPGAGGEVVPEAFDAFGRALGDHFDAAVGEVADVADHLMARGDALREEAESHALNLTADLVTTRDSHAVRDAFRGLQPRASRHPASGSLRQVYIGVSRSVYLLARVSRSSCTRSRKSAGWSVSKATTNS